MTEIRFPIGALDYVLLCRGVRLLFREHNEKRLVAENRYDTVNAFLIWIFVPVCFIRLVILAFRFGRRLFFLLRYLRSVYKL